MSVSTQRRTVGPLPAPRAGAGAHPPTQPGRETGLDLLRLLAICGVVAIHVIGMIVSNKDMRGTATWWAAAAIDLSFVWAVPVFVMISGALVLAPRAHASGPGAFYRKRFARILPALVAWHLIYLVGVRLMLRGENLSGETITRLFIDAKVFTALYFLWLIAGLYLIAPVLAAFLHAGGRRRAAAVAATALIWTLGASMVSGLAALIGIQRPLNLGALTISWMYVGYFVAGWALLEVTMRRRWIGTLAAGGGLLLVGVIAQYGVRPDLRELQLLLPVSYLGLSVAVLAICVFLIGTNLGRRWSVPSRLSRALARLSDASFGVFLVHLLIYELIKKALPVTAAGESLPVMGTTYLVVLVLSFAVSLGAARTPYLRTIF
ncbi:acyltransferase [Pilimelia columellifera]|uniref:Acyltransferase n=1 Tax=Pilimelia columellifera subsp. columellifera TaxID=706583 RepID=A0ABP6B1C6_9ACTN